MDDRKIIQLCVTAWNGETIYGLSDKGEVFYLSKDAEGHTCWQIINAYFNLIPVQA